MTIPGSVTDMGNYVFEDCTGLTSVTIPDGVTNIGNWAFAECTGLKSVTIPGSMTDIGERAFFGCEGLTSVTISDGVTNIGDWAFARCYSLTSVTIPGSVTSIGNCAFSSCDSLTDVYYAGSDEDWANVYIDEFNEPLLEAAIHYNSAMPEPSPMPEIKEPEVKPDEATGELNLTVETVNVPASAELIAISYGTDGGLVDITPVENGAASLDGENVKTIKLFCWESLESMKPLCPAKEVTVQTAQ